MPTTTPDTSCASNTSPTKHKESNSGIPANRPLSNASTTPCATSGASDTKNVKKRNNKYNLQVRDTPPLCFHGKYREGPRSGEGLVAILARLCARRDVRPVHCCPNKFLIFDYNLLFVSLVYLQIVCGGFVLLNFFINLCV